MDNQRDRELLEAIRRGRLAEACQEVVLPVLEASGSRLVKRLQANILEPSELMKVNCELKVIAELAAAISTAVQNGTAAQAEMVERSEPSTEGISRRRYNL